MTEMKLSDWDRAAVKHVLGLVVADQATHVWTLTDEQIAVLDDPDIPTIVEPLWLSRRVGDPMNPELLAIASEVAMRSMVARRDVRIRVEDSEVAEMTARPEIAGCLALRRLGHALIRAGRVMGNDPTIAYFYFLDEKRVFEEVVQGNGMHEFAIYNPDVLPSRMAEYIDPSRGAGLGQIDMTAPANEEALMVLGTRPEVAQAAAITNLTAVLRDQEFPRTATIYSSATGTYCLRQEPGQGETPVLRLTGIDRAGLEALPADLTRLW